MEGNQGWAKYKNIKQLHAIQNGGYDASLVNKNLKMRFINGIKILILFLAN